jgi:ceramide glucosyltransferase
MIYVFYVLSTLLVYYSVRSLIGGFRYLEYFRTELEQPLPKIFPFATVFAPCKGLDDGLRENLERLFVQDYSHYEIVFVVDSEIDPAVAVINDLRRTSELKTSLVIAPKASHSSQKVENLRAAVLHADPLSDVFVFVDSDARPAPNWLPSLAAPLADPAIGVSTGYRWFVADPSSFAGELRSMWNASVASSIGPNTDSNFCWGGSMAMRRDVFDRLRIRDVWSNVLSDDFAVTKAVKSAGLSVKFVPQSLTSSLGDCSFREMLEFTTRQMKITRVYAQHLWIQSFLGSGLFIVVMAASVSILLSSEDSFVIWWAAISLILVAATSIGKSIVRLQAVRLVLSDHEIATRRQYIWHSVLWCLTPLVFFSNCHAAMVSRRVNWRGVVYEMKSPTETSVVGADG